jgi:hypothetical protein
VKPETLTSCVSCGEPLTDDESFLCADCDEAVWQAEFGCVEGDW